MKKGTFGENKKRGGRRVIIVIAVLLVLVVSTIWYEIPVTEHFTVSSGGKVSSPVRFALVTDLHSEKYGEDQAELVSMIDKENVDAILMSGDIFDDRFKDDNTCIFIEMVADRYPCYYVAGNHEIWSGRVDEMKEFMRSKGVVVLEGGASEFEIGGGSSADGIADAGTGVGSVTGEETTSDEGFDGSDKGRVVIDICGVDDPTYMTDEEWYAQLDEAQAQADELGAQSDEAGVQPKGDHYRILLSHRPEKGDVYGAYNFDLVLCGHAHGGQWKIPFTQMGVHAPDQGQFPRFVDGEYDLANGATMIVSRGLARARQPYPRFFNHPEVVIVEITE